MKIFSLTLIGLCCGVLTAGESFANKPYSAPVAKKATSVPPQQNQAAPKRSTPTECDALSAAAVVYTAASDAVAQAAKNEKPGAAHSHELLDLMRTKNAALQAYGQLVRQGLQCDMKKK